jgi:hypothetical protein
MTRGPSISVKRVLAASIFDGWGYLSLYRRGARKIERVDSYAIPEALDPAFAFGFGDLSIHEIATDPGQNIAYSSFYAGGMRVFGFGASGIEELGHYIDADGSNFWGVETFVPSTSAAGNLEGSAYSRAQTATSPSSSSTTPAASRSAGRIRDEGRPSGRPLRTTGQVPPSENLREELLRSLLTRLREEVLGRPDLDDLAVGHEHHAVGDGAGEAHLVRDDDHRHA